jgi:hypothetical protein
VIRLRAAITSFIGYQRVTRSRNDSNWLDWLTRDNADAEKISSCTLALPLRKTLEYTDHCPAALLNVSGGPSRMN